MFLDFLRYTPEERQLLATYTEVFQADLDRAAGGDPAQVARRWLDEAIRESKRAGTHRRPPYYAEERLRSRDTDAAEAKRWERLRADGVRESDFLWWWSKCDAEHRLIERFDRTMRDMRAVLLSLENRSTMQATIEVQRSFPILGEVMDVPESQLGDPDRLLPNELTKRVVEYSSHLKSRSPNELIQEARTYSSVNCYIRAMIRRGRL